MVSAALSDVHFIQVNNAGSKVVTRCEWLIAAMHVPTMDQSILDGIVTVPSEDCLKMCHRLAREEGLFLGPSSGAAILGAVQVPNPPCDSTPLVSDWVQQHAAAQYRNVMLYLLALSACKNWEWPHSHVSEPTGMVLKRLFPSLLPPTPCSPLPSMNGTPGVRVPICLKACHW